MGSEMCIRDRPHAQQRARVIGGRAHRLPVEVHPEFGSLLPVEGVHELCHEAGGVVGRDQLVKGRGSSHTWSRVISRNGITRLLMSSTKRRIHLPHYRLPVVTSEEATPIDVVPSGDTARSPRSADWSRDAGHPASTAVRSACIPPRPTRRSRMRRADRRKPSPCVPTSPRGTSPGYTAEQREQLQLGLRILARMIVRAHLRREASLAILASAETASEAEASG